MDKNPIVTRDNFKEFRRLRVILETGDILCYGAGQRTLVTADETHYSEQPIKKNGEPRSNRWGVMLGWSNTNPKRCSAAPRRFATGELNVAVASKTRGNYDF